LTPPNGICASPPTVGPLMWQMPASMRAATAMARVMSRLNTTEDRLYSVALATRTASSSPFTWITGLTGPEGFFGVDAH
jgi:hypothetical protein